MVNERLLKAMELFARLIGVVIAAGGLLFLPSTPVLGVPLLAVGLLFALRPATASELLDIVASIA